jgi:hypothetical protein
LAKRQTRRNAPESNHPVDKAHRQALAYEEIKTNRALDWHTSVTAMENPGMNFAMT